jgi:hypothetical protein
MPHAKHHGHGRRSGHNQASKEERKTERDTKLEAEREAAWDAERKAEQEAELEEERERQESGSEQPEAGTGEIDRQDIPPTYTALTVDRKDLEEVPPANGVVGAAYDQQDGITKAKGLTLPPDALPDQQPGLPNVPVGALIAGAAPPAVPGENSPLPDQRPGKPNVPAVVVTDSAVTASQNAGTIAVNPDAVSLTQLPR